MGSSFVGRLMAILSRPFRPNGAGVLEVLLEEAEAFHMRARVILRIFGAADMPFTSALFGEDDALHSMRRLAALSRDFGSRMKRGSMDLTALNAMDVGTLWGILKCFERADDVADKMLAAKVGDDNAELLQRLEELLIGAEVCASIKLWCANGAVHVPQDKDYYERYLWPWVKRYAAAAPPALRSRMLILSEPD